MPEIQVRLIHEDGIMATVIPPATLRVRDEKGRELDVGLDEVEFIPPVPTAEMIASAREVAEQKAEELGIGIDEVAVVGTPSGRFSVVVLAREES